MDKYLTIQQAMVLRCFGQSAQIGGTLGSARGPGEITIHQGDVPLGHGPTFREAFQQASRRAAEMARRATP